jgi:2-C-methyl-D-erythritol 4-phosphate cytidylyltransferase
MASTESVSVILLAAGSGQRFGAAIPKCFVQIDGQSIIEKSFETVKSLNFVSQILVAVPSDLLHSDAAKKLQSCGAIVYAGGDTRRQSVKNGLDIVAKSSNPESSYCLIHDAARVFASQDLFTRTYLATQKYKAVTAAVKSVDSLKQVQADGLVVKSLDRNFIYSVQTPQGFLTSLIIKAHNEWVLNNLPEPTDDASMVEKSHPVYVVEGEYSNKKITFSEDL